MSWEEFLKTHWDILAATDFFTSEVASLRGIEFFNPTQANPDWPVPEA